MACRSVVGGKTYHAGRQCEAVVGEKDKIVFSQTKFEQWIQGFQHGIASKHSPTEFQALLRLSESQDGFHLTNHLF